MRAFRRRFLWALALLPLLLAFASPAVADDVAPAVTNLSPAPPPPGGFPTAGQFSSFAAVSSAAPATSAVARPASGTLRLQVSLFGATFAGAVPEFAIGDLIGTPLATFPDTQGRPVTLRREPVRKTETPFRYRLAGDPTVRDFDPATGILGERFYWSPDARFQTVADLSGLYERVAAENEPGATSHDGFAYASQPGSSRVFWRTDAPIAVDASQQPIYGLVDRTAVVSTASRRPVRSIFWTAHGFQGQTVAVPRGEVQQVRIAYSDALPAQVPKGEEYVPPSYNSQVPITRNTLWFENDTLNAYNREGRILVELLAETRTTTGLRRQVGIEVVDVIQEALPVLVQVPIGERLYPLEPAQNGRQSYPLPAPGAGRDAALSLIADNLALYGPSLVLSLQSQPFATQFTVAGQLAYYATRTTTSSSDVQMFWREPGLANIQWPKFLNRYAQYWPDDVNDYVVNVRPTDPGLVGGTLPIFGDAASFELVFQDDPTGQQVPADQSASFRVTLNAADPTNRALLLFRSGDKFWFVRVESVLDSFTNDPRYADFYGEGTVPVGERLVPPPAASTVAGYVDFTKGDAIDPSAYVDPFASGIPAAERGAILPVNAAPAKGAKANGQLGVWWFKKVQPPAALAGTVPTQYWPSFYRKYTLAWPTDAPPIVLASNAGSGDLSGDAAGGTIYFQNDPGQRGYNPNEEHAQMIAGRAYALRDDLNAPATTSSPYVLLRYLSAADQRPAMRAFRVLREDDVYTFHYDARAGTVLQPPMPLAVMPPPLQLPGRTSRNTEVTGTNQDPPPGTTDATDLGVLEYYRRFTFEDRKGLKWVYRGPHNPALTPPSLGMKFYYATQAGFAYPNATTGVNEAPAVGTITPFLADAGQDKKTGTAITVNFTPYWPDIGLRGVKAQYYLNPNLSGVPAITRIEPKIHFGFEQPQPAGMPAENFSARWTGFIEISATGAYRFRAGADDGVRLWIGDILGTPAVNEFLPRGYTEYPTGSYNFTAGERVAVKMEYTQSIGFAAANLQWQVPGTGNVWSVVPASAFVSSDFAEVPSLQFAETLVKEKNGLPSLRGASSARILYQQSVAKSVTTTAQESAVLHDATRRKVTLLGAGGLPALPSSIATSTSNGRTYFQRLPAHLQPRFYFDPTLGAGASPLGGLVLEGQFKDEIVGDDYLLPNVLSADDVAALKGLVTNADPLATPWRDAVNALSTTLQTFVENLAVPGTYIPSTALDETFSAAFSLSNPRPAIVKVTKDDQAVDSYALTGVGGGSGYVTLILGNGRAFTDQGEPVQVQILKVGPTDLYRGQVKPITAANPLAEDLTLQHTGDFAGRPEDYEFEWFYSPPVDGQPPRNLPREAGPTWFPNPSTQPRVALGASQPLLTLTDNYFVMRYRPKVGHFLRPTEATPAWSQWTAPALAEGWIKRVLAGINPFNQRVSDFYNNAVNTDVSLLTQAGTRWEGNIPLTLASAQDAGLIAIYETVLRRAIGLTIDGTPAIDYGPANDALLLAAGYLNDLYMALGNEAYADAANPTISLDVDPARLLVAQDLPSSIGTTIQSTASARFAFEGQVASLLDEELTLLRGRDDFLVPGARVAPVYNRFFWNFTRGINAGEVIYALNYNVTEKTGPTADGKIDATDAACQYPQGHGDAYGHYLTALKNYYRLLSDPEFTWTPRVEAVNILGVPVTVDYRDERKLALAAVSLGRAASRVVDLERRKLPVGSDRGWSALREAKTNPVTKNTRAWGVEQWAARAAQGNFIHWTVVNSLLPDNDDAHEGLQKIDRQNVPELGELVSLGQELQTHLDGANRHANALNLSDDGILFDLSPSQLAAGQSHFDQILARAKGALANAATAHARTVAQNALLRSVENQGSDYNFTVATQETAYANRLRELYGQPYAGDIGPGKTYPQGYAGPDLLRFMFIDRPYVYETKHIFGSTPRPTTFLLPIKQSSFTKAISSFTGTNSAVSSLKEMFAGIASSTDPTINFRYDFDLNASPYQIAPAALGARGSTGQTQEALARVMNAREQFYAKLKSAAGANENFEDALDRFGEDLDTQIKIRGLNSAFALARLINNKILGALELNKKIVLQTAQTNDELATATEKLLPDTIGLAFDASAPAVGAIYAAKVIANKTLTLGNYALDIASFVATSTLDVAELAKNEAVIELNAQAANRANIDKLLSSYGAVTAGVKELDAAIRELSSATNAYQNVLVQGLAVQEEREAFRKRAAAAIQGSRTRDVAFRAFRSETLEQYKLLFDQAARYTFLAAKAYDYETAQLGSNAGRDFLAGIVATRSLGLVGSGGTPQFGGSNSGDPGLSSHLARLEADWGVAKGRLGINNPDQYGTLFSLRRELFNLPYAENGSTTESHTAWQDRLRASLVADLRTDPDVAAHALPTANPSGLAQPGFVISFSSDINTGYNFFGNVLGAGDSAFSSASFSTKIHSVGIAFQGYLGMNPYATGSTGVPGPPTHGSPDALAATPYAYLIPAGADAMRTPPLNGAASTVRQWLVQDHAMPLPFDIGGGGFGQNAGWTGSTSLTEPFFLPRKHQPFRAVADPTLFYGTIPSEFTNRRLVGRSAWNTKWKLVIPAQTLLADPNDGIERFIRSVRDVKLFLRTYSHAGN